MKNLFSLLCIISIFSCASVPKAFIQTDDICHYDDSFFKIDSSEMQIKSELIDEVTNGKSEYLIEENKLKRIRVFKLSSGQFSKTNSNLEFNLRKWIRYRQDGSVRWVYFTYINGDSKIYQESHFDEQGNITKVIDYEKGYNICWAEAIELAKRKAKRRIKKNNITSFYLHRVDVSRSPNAQTKWRVILDGSDEFNSTDSVSYWFDGKTGEFLYEKYYKPAID